MIVIYKRWNQTNLVQIYDAHVPDISTMCVILENYRRANTSIKNTAQLFVAGNLDTAKPVMIMPGTEAFYALTIGERENHILGLGNINNGKFAIPINESLDGETNRALMKLLVHDWVRLIDVSLIAIGLKYYRIYVLSAIAYEWFHDKKISSSTPKEL